MKMLKLTLQLMFKAQQTASYRISSYHYHKIKDDCDAQRGKKRK